MRRGKGSPSLAAPPRVRDGALDDAHLNQIVAAFAITRDQVVAHQWADNGSGWAVLQLATAKEVLALAREQPRFRFPARPARRPARPPSDPRRVRGVRQNPPVVGRADAWVGGRQAAPLLLPVPQGRLPRARSRLRIVRRFQDELRRLSIEVSTHPFRSTLDGGVLEARMALKHAHEQPDGEA